MRLNEERLGELREQGFTNAGPVFEDDLLAEIRREYDRLVGFEHQVLGNPRDGVFPYRAMLSFRSRTLRRVIHHPELMEGVQQILGDDVRFWWDQGIDKAPGSGSAIPWHQDNGYHRGRVPEFLTCWLALDDSDAHNGGLEVVPGSHLEGPREHGMEGVHAMVPDHEVDADEAVDLDARAGDLLLFSSLLLHRTGGNRSARRHRRAWVMQYARGDVVNEVTGERYDDRAWVIRGGVVQDEPWSERRFDLRGSHDSQSPET